MAYLLPIHIPLASGFNFRCVLVATFRGIKKIANIRVFNAFLRHLI